VSNWHGECNSLSDVHSSLGVMQDNLKSWEGTNFGSVRKDLVSLRCRLEAIRRNNLHSRPIREERVVVRRLAEVLAREEIMVKQRSRIDWLREGDRNTGFFQAKLKQRARSNRIAALKRADGPCA
jgi:hypothetical protein